MGDSGPLGARKGTLWPEYPPPCSGPTEGRCSQAGGRQRPRTGSHRAPAVATRPAPPRLTGPGDTKVPAGSRPTRCTPRTGDRQSSSPRNLPRTLCPCALPGQRANSGRRRWTYGGHRCAPESILLSRHPEVAPACQQPRCGQGTARSGSPIGPGAGRGRGPRAGEAALGGAVPAPLFYPEKTEKSVEGKLARGSPRQ